VRSPWRFVAGATSSRSNSAPAAPTASADAWNRAEARRSGTYTSGVMSKTASAVVSRIVAVDAVGYRVRVPHAVASEDRSSSENPDRNADTQGLHRAEAKFISDVAQVLGHRR